MARISISFLVHQPVCLSEFSFFNIGTNKAYINQESTINTIDFLADNCYLIVNKHLLKLIENYPDRFYFSVSISGILLENLIKYRPDVIESFQLLAKTKCVEFLSTNYYQSLSFQYNTDEFHIQIEKQNKLSSKLFGQNSKVFVNTNLIYSNHLAIELEKLGFEAVIVPAVDRLLKTKAKHSIFGAKTSKSLKCILSDIELAKSIATSEKAAAEFEEADVFNLCFNYMEFIENSPYETFSSMNHLTKFIDNSIVNKNVEFCNISTFCTQETQAQYDVVDFISNELPNFDLQPWLSNSMQYESLSKVFSLRSQIIYVNDIKLMEYWNNLLSADFFLAMCTKFGDAYSKRILFNAYRSPYDAYISYMNIISDLELKLKKLTII